MDTSQAAEQARCVWCGATPVTNEHILGRSLLKLFGFVGESVIRHDYNDPEYGPRKPTRAKSFALKARRACETCNNGWMQSAVDEPAKPYLRHLAQGNHCVFREDAQATLSLWMAKVALMFIAKDRLQERRFAPPEDYEYVFRERTPGPHMQIWIGGNTKDELATFGSHSLETSIGGTRGATLTFGFGVLHLVSAPRLDARVTLRGQMREALRQIWPVVPGWVEWPPPAAFGPQHHLTLLPHAIGNESRWEFER